MTNILDYAPSLFAFALAVLGVLGHSKDASKDGIKAITRVGWVVVSLSFFMLLIGSISVHKRHVTQQSERLIANNMRPRLANGVELIVKPLCGSHREFVHETLTADIFELLNSDTNLESVGLKRTVERRIFGDHPGGSITAVWSGIRTRSFREPYEVYDYYITEGKLIVESTLDTFGRYFSEDEIVALSNLVLDDFLNTRYHLSGNRAYFESGLLDEQENLGYESPWNTFGLHYFGAVYEGSSARPGDVQPVRDLLMKARNVVELLEENGLDAYSFSPCVYRTGK